MDGKKFYNEIRFALAKNLSPDLLKQFKISKGVGLVAIKVSINSPLTYDIVPVTGSPTEFIRELGREEGITQEVLNKSLKEAFKKEE
jgi:hypothetical protein